jgi:hypothetical protein
MTAVNDSPDGYQERCPDMALIYTTNLHIGISVAFLLLNTKNKDLPNFFVYCTPL